jgi:hypothetical protein
MVILLLTLITAFMTPVDVAWYSSKTDSVIYDRRSAFIETVNLIICVFFAVDIAVSYQYYSATSTSSSATGEVLSTCESSCAMCISALKNYVH